MTFIESLKRGFGWGLGFGVALWSAFWLLESYVGSPARKVEHLYPSEYDDLTYEEIEAIEVAVDEIDMIEGKVIVSGNINNKHSRGLIGIGIGIRVSQNDRLIEKCRKDYSMKAPPLGTADFVVICKSKWSEIKKEDLNVEAFVTRASYEQDNT